MGIRDASKYLCTLQEDLITTGFIFVLNNGSPFLNRLNALTRRSLEGGLLDRYWAQLMWVTILRCKTKFGDGEEDLYFVFSLSHLSPAFFVLGFGYVLSSVVFLAEIFVNWIDKDRTVRWNGVPKRRHCEPKTAPLLTRLKIQKTISAIKMCEFKRQKYFDFKCKG
jgi:hypothetical protein